MSMPSLIILAASVFEISSEKQTDRQTDKRKRSWSPYTCDYGRQRGYRSWMWHVPSKPCYHTSLIHVLWLDDKAWRRAAQLVMNNSNNIIRCDRHMRTDHPASTWMPSPRPAVTLTSDLQNVMRGPSVFPVSFNKIALSIHVYSYV